MYCFFFISCFSNFFCCIVVFLLFHARVMNKAGPHNVVFDEDNIPSGVDQEAISMSDQIGDEGDTFEMKFDTAGEYAYYCEPHRGAGMNGVLIVA